MKRKWVRMVNKTIKMKKIMKKLILMKKAKEMIGMRIIDFPFLIFKEVWLFFIWEGV